MNKTISAEATSYFYTENAFAVVHFNMPGFHLMTNMVDLPIVAHIGVEVGEGIELEWDFRPQVCLSMSLKWPNAPYVHAVGGLNHPKNDHGMVVMRLCDLPELFKILRYLCAQTIPHSVLIGSSRGEACRLRPAPRWSQLEVSMTNWSQMYRPLSQSKQNVVLELLESLLGAGHGIRVQGFAESAQRVRGLERAMNRSLVWPLAFLTDHFAMNRRMMREADRVALDGGLQTAMARYEALHSFLKACYSLIWTEFRMWPAVEQFIRICGSHYRLDLGCSVAGLHIRLRNYDGARLQVRQCLAIPWMAGQAHSWTMHLHTILDLAACESDGHFKLAYATIQGFIDVLELLPTSDTWIAHDIAVLKEALKGRGGEVSIRFHGSVRSIS